MMRMFDLSFRTPAENLACDEALLEWCELNCGPEVLRFWEASQPFVVLGYGKKVAEEIDSEACRVAGVPILRRCTGGGTVVQGPGCLSYALVLDMRDCPALAGVTEANAFIMERNRAALGTLLRGEVAVKGITDLTWNGLKFSGNAQRRKKRYLLFHGTVLLDFDLSLMGRLLRHPVQQPAYRSQRAHREFVTNSRLAAEAVKAALVTAWHATELLSYFPQELMDELTPKYGTDAWNLKY